MSSSRNKRELLSELRSELDEWVYDAKQEAFVEVFRSQDSDISKDELQLLDSIDSHLTRQEGQGIWDSDRYGIISTSLKKDGDFHVVCTSHPEIPEYNPQKEGWTDTKTREKLNDALWRYSEKIVEITQQKLEKHI